MLLDEQFSCTRDWQYARVVSGEWAGHVLIADLMVAIVSWDDSSVSSVPWRELRFTNASPAPETGTGGPIGPTTPHGHAVETSPIGTTPAGSLSVPGWVCGPRVDHGVSLDSLAIPGWPDVPQAP